MKTFVDNAGRTWTVAVNVDAIKRVRTLCEVNLLEVVEGDLLGRLANDPILLCDVLYAVCKPELDAKSVSDEDFGRAMGGDVIEAATAAFLEEMVGFFPSPKRAVLAKALGKLRVLEERALRAVETRLDDPRLLAEVEKQLAALEVEATPAGG
ncbi:MAG TPA: hypothetical protein PLP01_17030 [Phycisphaerae bacterium]|nr:hypothetical protein [Phycisphaerae bacterium]